MSIIPQPQPCRPLKLAGFVLAVLGFFTYGSTCPFALVLGLEWMADHRRCPHRPLVDQFSVALGCVFGAFWVLVSVTFLAAYVPTLVIAYWVTFAGWVVVRLFTRWRDIAADRRRNIARLPPRG